MLGDFHAVRHTVNFGDIFCFTKWKSMLKFSKKVLDMKLLVELPENTYRLLST